MLVLLFLLAIFLAFIDPFLLCFSLPIHHFLFQLSSPSSQSLIYWFLYFNYYSVHITFVLTFYDFLTCLLLLLSSFIFLNIFVIMALNFWSISFSNCFRKYVISTLDSIEIHVVHVLPFFYNSIISQDSIFYFVLRLHI